MHKRKIIENNFNNNEAPIKLSEPKTKWLNIFFLFQKSQKGMNVEKERNEKRTKKKKPEKKGMIKKNE